MRALGLSLVVVAVSGCGGMAELPPAIDAGVPVDAGAKPDAGAPNDAGTKLDAGLPFDAGAPFDAGLPLVNDSEYVSQTVPASVAAGSTFPVKVTMRNTGTTSWALVTQGHYLGSE